MTKDETKKIISYLLSAYPKTDLGDKKQTEAHFKVWEEILMAFPYDVSQQAAKEYIIRGNKFFPAIGEFAILCDEIWKNKIAVRATPKVIEEITKENKSLKKDCLKLINEKLTGKIDLKTYIDEIRKLDTKYPAIGFDRSVFELSKI